MFSKNMSDLNQFYKMLDNQSKDMVTGGSVYDSNTKRRHTANSDYEDDAPLPSSTDFRNIHTEENETSNSAHK